MLALLLNTVIPPGTAVANWTLVAACLSVFLALAFQIVADYPLVIRNDNRPKDSSSGKKARGSSGAEKTVNVTISLGCCVKQKGETPMQLLKRADEALYAAKKAGRNTFVLKI